MFLNFQQKCSGRTEQNKFWQNIEKMFCQNRTFPRTLKWFGSCIAKMRNRQAHFVYRYDLILANVVLLYAPYNFDKKYLSFQTSKFNEVQLRLLASANSTTVVELIVELIGELFIVGELSYCNYLEFLKACFKIIHYKILLTTYLIAKWQWKKQKQKKKWIIKVYFL